MAGSAALGPECRKHDLNDPMGSKVGLEMHTTSNGDLHVWLLGGEARKTLSCLATRLAIPMRCIKPKATASIYPHLGEVLCKSSAVKNWNFIGHH